MNLVLSEIAMLLLFTVLPLTIIVFVIIYIRNWMVKQTKLKEEQNRLLQKIANQSK
jgi:hypothetical protein